MLHNYNLDHRLAAEDPAPVQALQGEGEDQITIRPTLIKSRVMSSCRSYHSVSAAHSVVVEANGSASRDGFEQDRPAYFRLGAEVLAGENYRFLFPPGTDLWVSWSIAGMIRC